jgi:hypothetical protein
MTMTTHRLLDNYHVVVPEHQKADYAAVVGEGRVITHADDLIGLTRKRQWILDNLMDDECVVMLDDDVDKVLVMFEDKNRYITDPQIVEDIIHQTYTVARDIGAHIFGWQILAQNIKFYTGMEPFKMSTMIHGIFGVVAGHNLFFNADIKCNEDSWITLLNAYLNRYCLKDQRFAFVARCFEGEGGQAGIRNVAVQDEDFAILRRYFGPCVKQNKKYLEDGGLVPIKLNLPF